MFTRDAFAVPSLVNQPTPSNYLVVSVLVRDNKSPIDTFTSPQDDEELRDGRRLNEL